MKIDILFIYIIGYILFCILMQCFGIGELITSYLSYKYKIDYDNNGYNDKFNINNKDNTLFIEKKTEIKPDNQSTALSISKEELGKLSWTLFHSIAATFPIEPDTQHKKALINFVDSLKYLYPCKICREHYRSMIERFSLLPNGRSEVVKFFCNIHNEVNKTLGKNIFDCSKAFNHWGGDCGCEVNNDKE